MIENEIKRPRSTSCRENKTKHDIRLKASMKSEFSLCRARGDTMRRFLSWSIRTSSCGTIIESSACSQKLIVAAAA